ncbi:MAG: hypothetical protein ACRCX5_05515, partial [Bacteroidales bacterium]
RAAVIQVPHVCKHSDSQDQQIRRVEAEAFYLPQNKILITVKNKMIWNTCTYTNFDKHCKVYNIVEIYIYNNPFVYIYSLTHSFSTAYPNYLGSRGACAYLRRHQASRQDTPWTE